MSNSSQSIIAPVAIAITSISADPDLTIEGIDLDNGGLVSISIKADGFADSMSIGPTAPHSLVLVLSLQSVTSL